jgi:acyl-CoA thioesterase-1
MPLSRPAEHLARLPILLVFLAAGVLSACDGRASTSELPSDGALPATIAEAPIESAPVIPDGAPTVVFLGDSLAAGLHLARDEAFPAVLQRRLAESGHAFHLINAGVSGSTTAGGVARVDWVLQQKPDVVVIELGANDGFRGIPLATIEENLRKIIASVRGAGARPLLLGIRLPPNYGAEYAGGFDALFQRVGDDTSVPVVPYFMEGVAGVPDLNLPDGIHPTPEGHRRLADNLESALAEVLSAE